MKAAKKVLSLTVLAGALGFAATAHAGALIDLFSEPAGTVQEVTVQTLGGIATNQNAAIYDTTKVLGGWRDLYVEKTADGDTLPNNGASTLTAGGGKLDLSNATGNKSVGGVTWDGANVTTSLGNAGNVDKNGLGGVNLAVGGADRFEAQVNAADLGFDYVIRVWDLDGDLSELSASVQFRVGFDAADCGTDPNCVVGPVIADYLFSWFNLASGAHSAGGLDFVINRPGGLINFSSIGALQLQLSNSSTFSVDLSLGTIETVPEPSSVALIGLGLASLGAAAVRRRRKSA